MLSEAIQSFKRFISTHTKGTVTLDPTRTLIRRREDPRKVMPKRNTIVLKKRIHRPNNQE